MMYIRAMLLPALVVLLTLIGTGFLWWQIEATHDSSVTQARDAGTLRAAQLADAMAGQTRILLGNKCATPGCAIRPKCRRLPKTCSPPCPKV